MNYKTKIIIFTVLLVLSFNIAVQAETLSLISSSELTATPQALYIKLEIQGEDRNQARLQNQFKKYINDLKSALIKNNNLNSTNISQSQIINSSYIKQTGYNKPQIYQKKINLEIKLSVANEKEIQTAAEKIIALINDNNPRYHNAHYNSLFKLKLNYQGVYYCFENPQSLQKELLSNILDKNKRKADTLAELLASNSATLTKIKEIETTDISNYEQQVNLNQPQIPTEVTFKSTFRVNYQLN